MEIDRGRNRGPRRDSDLDWFGPDELPTEVREYDQKLAHLRSLG